MTSLTVVSYTGGPTKGVARTLTSRVPGSASLVTESRIDTKRAPCWSHSPCRFTKLPGNLSLDGGDIISPLVGVPRTQYKFLQRSAFVHREHNAEGVLIARFEVVLGVLV